MEKWGEGEEQEEARERDQGDQTLCKLRGEDEGKGRRQGEGENEMGPHTERIHSTETPTASNRKLGIKKPHKVKGGREGGGGEVAGKTQSG